MSAATSKPGCIWPLSCTLGEGPVWDAERGALWFVDIKKKAIHRLNEQTRTTQSWPCPEQCGFLAPTLKGDFLVGLESGLYRFSPATGEFDAFDPIESNKPGNRLNDGFVDASGRLWFGSMDDGEDIASGKLYLLTNEGVVERDNGYVITNGPAVSPDGKTLYHVDTLERTIYAFDLAADGNLSNKRIFARVQRDGAYADGPAVDAEGNLWLSTFHGWGIERFASDGTYLETINLPVPNVTKIAFGGADLKTVYVTTAAKGLSKSELADAPLSGGLFSFRSRIAGLPQNTVSVGL